MKKKIIIIISIAFVVLVAISVYLIYSNKKVNENKILMQSAASVPQKISNLVTVEKIDSSFKVPEGWKDESSADGKFAQFFNPVGVKTTDLNGEIMEYISVRKESLGGKEINIYADGFKNFLNKIYSQSKFVFPENGKFINNRLAFYIELDKAIEGINFKEFNVLIDAGNKKDIWVLTYDIWSENWNLNKDIFYQSAGWFKDKTSK